MKNKILMISLLAIAFVFTNSASAIGPNGATGNSNQPQVVMTSQMGEAPLQAQQQGDNQTENDTLFQNQNQQQNQGEENQIQNQEQEIIEIEEGGSAMAEQRRSQVANAVHEMLQVAERNGGIGEQVRVIAQAQNQNQEQLRKQMGFY